MVELWCKQGWFFGGTVEEIIDLGLGGFFDDGVGEKLGLDR